MDTKLKVDITEQAAILFALHQGWGVLTPVRDSLPYDLVFDVGGRLLKFQVKSAWFDAAKLNWAVDTRRTKTNRRKMIRSDYLDTDFDFALLYIDQLDIFYVMPSAVFISYSSEIHLVESVKRQRRPKSADYREAWHLPGS